MREDLLIVLCRPPRPGAVKPRLTPPLGDKQASAAYAAMLMDTELNVRAVPRADAWFWCSGSDSEALRGLLPPESRLVEHTGDSLGASLVAAFEGGFAAGYRRVVIIGTDTPDLPTAYIQTAFDRLRDDVDLAAFGPALDGGIYLAGLSRLRPEMFHGVPWHEPTAWLAVRSAATRLGIPLALLPRWQDVDTWADLQDCLARGRATNLLALRAHHLLEPCEPT